MHASEWDLQQGHEKGYNLDLLDHAENIEPLAEVPDNTTDTAVTPALVQALLALYKYIASTTNYAI